MTTSKINHHDTQYRISSSKRTTINNVDQSIDNNPIVKTNHSSRVSKSKHNCEILNQSPSKGESGSDDVYTTPLNNEAIKITSSITQKHRTRQEEIGDYNNEDIDEESTALRAIMTQIKTPTERIHRLSSPSSNNSAIHLQQQGTGDHYHQSNTKQHRSRNKTIGKYQQDIDERNIYRWRLFMYILTITILAFVIYRFLIALWPKPKKTLIKQLVDDLSNFFTP